MTISDGLPIQFWSTNCPTYNEALPAGIFAACYNQSFDCDDEIRLQITDGDNPSSESELSILFLDQNGDTVYELTFDQSEYPLVENYDTSDITAFSETATDGTFTWSGAYSSVVMGGPGFGISYLKYTPLVSTKAIKAQVFYEHEVLSGVINASTLHVGLYDASFNLITGYDIVTGSGTSSGNPTIELDPNGEETAYIGFKHYVASSFAGVSRTLVDAAVVTSNLYPGRIVYSASFIPSELSPEICNEKLQLQIINNDLSPAEIAKSDFIEFKTHVPDSVLIKYSNARAYAGIDFSMLEPGETFSLRIPAIFFHERFPGEDETTETSTKIISLNGVMRAQKLLDTGYLPYYMHKKLQLILNCQYVEIERNRWTKQEAYEIQEGNKRHPLKRATCWLSDRGFVARNVI